MIYVRLETSEGKLLHAGYPLARELAPTYLMILNDLFVLVPLTKPATYRWAPYHSSSVGMDAVEAVERT